MDIVTLSSKGQVVIPKSVRDQAQIARGSRFTVQYLDGEIRLRPLASSPMVALHAVAGCLASAGRKRLTEVQAQTAIKARLRART